MVDKLTLITLNGETTLPAAVSEVLRVLRHGGTLVSVAMAPVKVTEPKERRVIAAFGQDNCAVEWLGLEVDDFQVCSRRHVPMKKEV